jgi:hypothetical protein
MKVFFHKPGRHRFLNYFQVKYFSQTNKRTQGWRHALMMQAHQRVTHVNAMQYHAWMHACITFGALVVWVTSGNKESTRKAHACMGLCSADCVASYALLYLPPYALLYLPPYALLYLPPYALLYLPLYALLYLPPYALLYLPTYLT